MRPRQFASAILIDTQGRLLFQRRDNVPGILYPGRVALFGGHREGDETFVECVCREVWEEISYLVPPERFEWMADYSGLGPAGEGVIGNFFIARDIPVDVLTITEGALLIIERDELQTLVPQLVPSAQAAVSIFTANCGR
jgi:8-oxo-dGTP pyrophosphatase MutT (NUDIX family)